MTKKCSQSPPASRADTGSTLSRRLECRQQAFRPADSIEESLEEAGFDENGSSVFLMNRFYGEKTILPMIECVKREFAGDIGQKVASLLEKKMLEKNGYIKGDALLELLKNGMGLESAVSLIGQMNRFKKLGLYDDSIVTRLSGESAGKQAISGSRTKQRKTAVSDCSDRKTESCQGCVRKTSGKENANWKKKSEMK